MGFLDPKPLTPGALDAVAAGLVANPASDLAGELSATYLKRGFELIVPTGVAATDTAAINAALATGSDVEVCSLATTVMGINATLVMHPTRKGQRLTTRNVRIAPNFIGDAVQIRMPNQAVRAEFSGSLQPAGTTAYEEVCAIRIGSADAVYNAKNASVAGSSIVDAWKGNGIIWEQGAHIDFGHFSIDASATYDGIRGTANCDDNNEGNFIGTRVSNCARAGYWFQYNVVPEKSSRHHRFNNAKAFNCSPNFKIETNTNTGEIFSELGQTPDELTATSFANSLEYGGTNSMYASAIDNGTGNRLSGLNAYGKWDTRVNLARSHDVNGLFAGRQRFTHTADGMFLDTILDTVANATVTHNHGGAGVRTDTFAGPVNANDGLSVAGKTLNAGAGLGVTGNVRYNSSTRTANITLSSASAAVNVADASSGPFTITLPSSANGTEYTIVKTDSSANAVTVGGTINGVSGYVLTAQYKHVRVISSGSNTWFIVGSN